MGRAYKVMENSKGSFVPQKTIVAQTIIAQSKLKAKSQLDKRLKKKMSLAKNQRTTMKILLEALQASLQHHEYCGWGDEWERGCAREQKLQDKIEAAVKRGRESLGIEEQIEDIS